MMIVFKLELPAEALTQEPWKIYKRCFLIMQNRIFTSLIPPETMADTCLAVDLIRNPTSKPCRLSSYAPSKANNGTTSRCHCTLYIREEYPCVRKHTYTQKDEWHWAPIAAYKVATCDGYALYGRPRKPRRLIVDSLSLPSSQAVDAVVADAGRLVGSVDPSITFRCIDCRLHSCKPRS